MTQIELPDFSEFLYAPVTSNTWALLNLLLVVVGVILALLALLDSLGARKQKKIEAKIVYNKITFDTVTYTPVENRQFYRDRLDWLIMAELLGFSGVPVFLLTQNIRSTMALMNQMTIAHVIIFIIQIVALKLVYRREKI